MAWTAEEKRKRWGAIHIGSKNDGEVLYWSRRTRVSSDGTKGF